MKIHLIAVVIASVISSNMSLAETPDVEWQDRFQEGGKTQFQSITGIVSSVPDDGFLSVTPIKYTIDEEIRYTLNGLDEVKIQIPGVEVTKGVLSDFAFERRVHCMLFDEYDEYMQKGYTLGGCGIVFSNGQSMLRLVSILEYYGLAKRID